MRGEWGWPSFPSFRWPLNNTTFDMTTLILRWAKTRVLKTDTLACRKMPEASLSIGRLRVGAFSERARRKNAFKHNRIHLECRNRLRVGVRAKNASVSGFVCRPF